MALMKCNECGEKVSDKAGSCPHCGAPIKLDEVYNDIEQDIVTVKVNLLIIIVCCIMCTMAVLPLTIKLYTTTSIGIYSFIPIGFILIMDLITLYIFKNSYITLTNKRVKGKITHVFGKDEVDYPLRQIKDISAFEIFGISLFRISTGYQWFQVPFAVNGKKFKREYFNLIENKYKY